MNFVLLTKIALHDRIAIDFKCRSSGDCAKLWKLSLKPLKKKEEKPLYLTFHLSSSTHE